MWRACEFPFFQESFFFLSASFFLSFLFSLSFPFSPFFSPFSSRGLYLRYTFVANPIRVPGHDCAPVVHFCGESGPGPEPMRDMLRLVCGGLVGGLVGW